MKYSFCCQRSYSWSNFLLQHIIIVKQRTLSFTQYTTPTQVGDLTLPVICCCFISFMHGFFLFSCWFYIFSKHKLSQTTTQKTVAYNIYIVVGVVGLVSKLYNVGNEFCILVYVGVSFRLFFFFSKKYYYFFIKSQQILLPRDCLF